MALFLSTDTFAYIDVSDRIIHVDGNDVVDRGPWSAANSYVLNNVVRFQNTLYVCLTGNTNMPPTAIRDDFWSSLVLTTGVTPPLTLKEVYDLATSARITADVALNTAWAGTALAYTALQQAWFGTEAAVTIGYPALVMAWTGTATADVALEVAGAGTDLAYQALQQAWSGTLAAAQIGYPALVTAWVGTATANSALSAASTGTLAAAAGIALANKALALAQVGTVIPFLDDLQDVNAPTPSAAQVLAWDGSKWIASDMPSQVAPGAYTLFLDAASSGTSAYSSLLPVPSGTPEVQDVAVVGGANPIVLSDSFLASQPLDTTLINAGVWEFNNYASVDNAAQPTQVIIDLYTKALATGAETYLFSGTSPNITSLTPTPQLVTAIVAQGTYHTALSDKLLARHWFRHTGTSVVTAICYHGGTAHDSHFHTPIGFAHDDLPGLQGGQLFEYYHTTADQNAALVGSQGHPSASNPFATQEDPHLATADLALQMAWSGTSGVNAVFPIAVTGTNLATTALHTAWVGTATGNVALAVASQGTDEATRALQTAWTGTSGVAAEAIARAAGDSVLQSEIDSLSFSGSVTGDLGYVALKTAWSGTAGVNQVFPIATAGTNLAYTALQTAWTGTVARQTTTITTGTLAANAVELGQATLGKSVEIIQLSSPGTVPFRFRLYSTSTARSADLNRAQTSRPTISTQHQVITDIALNGTTGFSWIMSPKAVGSNGDNAPSATLYYNIANVSSGTAAISVAVLYNVTEH